MESKEGKKFNFKIGGIVAIAVVAAIVGTLAFTNFETNSDSNTNTQSIGIGAFVTVEVFDKDGNLSQTWEGHNELGNDTRGFMAICHSGLITDNDANKITCGSITTDTVILFLGVPGQQATAETPADSTDITMEPPICFDPVDFSGNGDCTGWTVVGTYDVPAGPACTPGVDCLELRDIGTLNDFFGIFFNTIDLQPFVIVEPGDKVIVTMNFEIPL